MAPLHFSETPRLSAPHTAGRGAVSHGVWGSAATRPCGQHMIATMAAAVPSVAFAVATNKQTAALHKVINRSFAIGPNTACFVIATAAGQLTGRFRSVLKDCYGKWDLNPRPFGLDPDSSALDRSAISAGKSTDVDFRSTDWQLGQQGPSEVLHSLAVISVNFCFSIAQNTSIKGPTRRLRF